MSGGKSAALVDLRCHSYIVAQVPLDAAQGNQSFVVRNGNGEGTAVTVRLPMSLRLSTSVRTEESSQRLDYSLVTHQTPARAGDLIWAMGPGSAALTGRLERRGFEHRNPTL